MMQALIEHEKIVKAPASIALRSAEEDYMNSEFHADVTWAFRPWSRLEDVPIGIGSVGSPIVDGSVCPQGVKNVVYRNASLVVSSQQLKAILL